MAADSNRIHTFFLLKEPGRPDRIVVWDTQEISLGRSQENDIAIDHAEISRKHVQFARTGKSYVAQNLNTSNGTLVNGEPVTTHTLQPRDVIRVAEIELTFYQSTKDPVALGKKVDYASQLKSFPGPSVAAGDAEATMLGLADTLSGSDEDFEVKPAGEFAYDLHGMDDGPGDASAPRDLDLELDGFGLDDLDVPGEAPPQAAQPVPPPAAEPSPPPAKAEPDVWELEDVAAPDVAESPVAKAPATLSLQLEIQGLEGELRQVLQGLMGKIIELPALKIRIKNDDLG
jgi:predicted component of type VI protein secretion system